MPCNIVIAAHTWYQVGARWSFKSQICCHSRKSAERPSPEAILDAFSAVTPSAESELTHITVVSSPSSNTFVTLSFRSKVGITHSAVIPSEAISTGITVPSSPPGQAFITLSRRPKVRCAFIAVTSSHSTLTLQRDFLLVEEDHVSRFPVLDLWLCYQTTPMRWLIWSRYDSITLLVNLKFEH